jgi:carbamoyltransferase
MPHRESFRPFAASVLAERAAEYFALSIESPYMLLVALVLQGKQSVVPAIVHVDGTARVQTVTRADNQRYYELIDWFYRRGELW